MRPQQGVQLMCDYSAESARQRRAVVGDDLVIKQFADAHVTGAVSVADPTTAVCLLPGTTLMVRDIPVAFQEQHGLGSTAVATFAQREPVPEFPDSWEMVSATSMLRDCLVFEGVSGHHLLMEVGVGAGLSVLTIPGVTELPGESGEVAVHNPASVDQGEYGVWREIASEYA
jgi:hypothetical protein